MSTQPPAYLVPGTPIRVADMVAGTKLSEGEKATYGSYLPILLDGWTSPTGRHYEGVGHRWAHEVLPSELDTLVEAVLERALITSAIRDQNREDAGRATKESKGERGLLHDRVTDRVRQRTPLALRWVRVVAVRVAVADLSVAAVEEELDFLTSGSGSPGSFGVSLGGVH